MSAVFCEFFYVSSVEPCFVFLGNKAQLSGGANDHAGTLEGFTEYKTSDMATRVQDPREPMLRVDKSLYTWVRTLNDNDHFGEESCIAGEPSPLTYVPRSYCKALALSGTNLEMIMSCHEAEINELQSACASCACHAMCTFLLGHQT
jgi:hypothetical protein